jgi:hypothetical protein
MVPASGAPLGPDLTRRPHPVRSALPGRESLWSLARPVRPSAGSSSVRRSVLPPAALVLAGSAGSARLGGCAARPSGLSLCAWPSALAPCAVAGVPSWPLSPDEQQWALRWWAAV